MRLVEEYVEIQEETEEAQVDGSLWDALQRMTNKRRRHELWLCRSRLSRFAKAVQEE
jgi:hypothetical protein